MTNIKTKIINNKLKFTFPLETDNSHSDTDFYINQLQNGVTESAINDIEDFEVKDFSYDGTNLAFHVFFYKEINLSDFALINEMDSSFYDYQTLLLKELSSNTLYGFDDQILVPVNENVYEININSSTENTIRYTGTTTNDDTNYPSFYNSFVYPFYKKDAGWLNNIRKFKDQPFLYNSFLKIDFFTTPSKLTQQSIFSQTINVNPRYCLNETQLSGFKTLRPSFNLDSSKDGFHLYWLNKFPLSEFYVLLRFWDAYNGKLYNLIPSTDLSPQKKWVQNSESFDQNILFLKYKINYETQKFEIYEYNLDAKSWINRADSFDLHQLVYNNSYASIIPNIKINRETIDVKQSVTINPSYSAELTSNLLKKTYYKDLTSYTKDGYRDYFRKVGNFSDFLGSVYLKNTGTGDLFLQKINVTWIGNRITTKFTHEEFNAEWNKIPKYIEKNFITYSDLVTRTDSPFGTDLPLKTKDVGMDYFKERYGEKLIVRFNGDYNTIIKNNDNIKIDFNFNLGGSYFWAYLDIPLRDAFNPYLNSYNYNVTYYEIFKYKVDIILSDKKVTESVSNLPNDIKKTIIVEYPFKIEVKNGNS